MKFNNKLLEGRLIKRYKRFFADVELNGEVVVAHVPNTGSMKSCSDPGSPCLVSPADNPERKLKFTLEMVKSSSGSWVGVNTANPTKLVREAFENKVVEAWKKYDCAQAECKINDESRLDYVFWNSKYLPADTKINAKNLNDIAAKKIKLHFVEIKNTTLAEDQMAMFPDAITTRGQKHIEELMLLTKSGFTVELAFVVQREDCLQFKVADHIDPDYAYLLESAHKNGLIVSPYTCKLSPNEILLTGQQLKF